MQVPSLLQVASWSQCLLDAQFMTFAVDAGSQPVLLRLQATLDGYVGESQQAALVSRLLSALVTGGPVAQAAPVAHRSGWAAQWLNLHV